MLRRTIPALPFHIVLLLVALFNALAGAPLHEARHIQELVRSAAASATAGNVDAYAATSSAASDEHSEETHTTCAWCLTHALEAGLAHAPARLPHAPARLPHSPAESGAIAPQSADPFTAQQVRWPFAARDPPPAQRA
ncbi:hypothetical protein ACFOW3_29360 [Acidovorax facilis]|uniref:DUF2946 domain-containing protein n=1 Tax=Acidovorax facilis TaxID=12917 RepID=A0ABV8DJP2_9BURK|nr:hypothetical protein [Acidovorax facilis]MCO4242517.1 hypothetical protein [Acidovorax facilis]